MAQVLSMLNAGTFLRHRECQKGRTPAYTLHWLYSSYFVTCIIINSHIFMSIFLAVVYDNDRKHLQVLRNPQ